MTASVAVRAPADEAAGKEETPVIPEPPVQPGEAKPAAARPSERKAIPGGGRLTVSADEASRRSLGAAPDGGGELTETVFAGKVEAERGTLRLNCARLSAVMTGGGAGRGEPLRCTAGGDVVIRDGADKAVAERADYDCAREKLTLSGGKRPVIYHGEDAVAAESFVLHRLTGVFEARGRTSAVIMPRERKPDEAVPAPAGRDDAVAPDMNRKTRVDCSGGAVYDRSRSLLFLRDDVLIRQEGFSLSCDRGWALFEPRDGDGKESGKPPAGGDAAKLAAAREQAGKLARIIAGGNVRVESATRSAEADGASYDPQARTVTMWGGSPGPVIRDGDSYLTAQLIIYHLDGDRIESPNGPFKAVLGGRNRKRGADPVRLGGAEE